MRLRAARWVLSVLRGVGWRLGQYVLRDQELEAALVPLALDRQGAFGPSWFSRIVHDVNPAHRGYLATSAAGALYLVELSSHAHEDDATCLRGERHCGLRPVLSEPGGEASKDREVGVELHPVEAPNSERKE